VSLTSLLRAIALSTLLLLVARVARAGLAVALIQPDPSYDAERSAFVQLRAELETGGYDVVVVTARPDVEADLESVARQSNAPAAIRLRSDEKSLVAEIWTKPQPTEIGELATARADGDGIEASRTLALRSVEILRGRGLSADEPEPRVSLPKARRFGVGLGLEVLGHPSGLPAAVATMLTAGFRLEELRFEVRALSAAETRLVEPEGEATFDQALVLASLRVDPLFERAISPFFGFSGGAYALAGESNTLAGLRAKSELLWTATFGGLAGASFRVYESDALAVELVARFDCLWLSPQPVVRFVERPVVKAGQPLLAGAFGGEVLF
jgi:hypothetical protein